MSIPDRYLTDAYRRAVASEPMVGVIEAAAVAFARAGYGVSVAWPPLKMMLEPYVGTGRGLIPENAHPEGEHKAIPCLSGEELINPAQPIRTEAINVTERWLRTSQAFDVVADVWLAYMYSHDDNRPLRHGDAKEYGRRS